MPPGPGPAFRDSTDRYGPSAAPGDPRHILTSIGIAVYDWDIATDGLAWGANAADVLGVKEMSAWSAGRDYALVVEPGSGTTRADNILGSKARDEGSGVPYCARYAVRTGPRTLVHVEDSGRWYADPAGRPVFAHGMMRVHAGPIDVAHRGGASARGAFLAAIADDVVDAAQGKRPLTVFVMAIANLPALNDDFGFDLADQVIDAVIARLQGVMRRRDKFARYSGNRFAIALRACARDDATIAARRLRGSVEMAVETPRGSVAVDLLIGAASAPDHALEPAVLLRRAEQSLGDLKRQAGSSFQLFDPRAARAETRRPTERSGLDVVGLLNARRVRFAAQPIVEAGSRRLAFSEALLRIEGPDGRLTPAGDIIPTIERTGLVSLVDTRILELAVDHLAKRPRDRLSINVSPLTFDNPEWLTTLAAHLGGRPDIAPRLIVEITETAAVRDPDEIRKRLDAMKALGVAIAIDDFGAGHTSFRHLRNFPIDMVKIDGVFVQNLSRSADDRFFVRTLIDLAGHLGVATVAEWVEDEQTAQLLASWGVDYLQGDYLGRPSLPAELDGDRSRASVPQDLRTSA